MKAQQSEQKCNGSNMDVTTMLVSAGIGSGVGIASTALMFWKNSSITDVQFQERLTMVKEELQRDIKDRDAQNAEFTADVKGILTELRAVILTVAKLQSSQDVVNAVNAAALDGITRKMESQEKQITELQGSVSFTRQLFERLERKGT